jgi:putative nucleotidyltransferase with HDIG domain
MGEGVLLSDQDLTTITRLLPEIGEISDPGLREKVAATWLRLWKLSGYADLTDAFFMPDIPDVSLIDHTRSVTRNALALARVLEEVHGLRINYDRLLAAALLHDASKCVEYERKPDGTCGRSELGKNLPHSYLVVEIGRQVGVPDDICHLVAAHSPTSPVVPRYVEGAILLHADLADLDCLAFVRGRLTERLKKGQPALHYADLFEGCGQG